MILALALALAILVPLSSSASTFLDAEYIIDSWETDRGLPENSATAMVQTPDGYLWFGTYNGLVRFNGMDIAVLNPSNTRGLPSPGIVNIYLDAGQRLWVSTYEGLVVSDPGRYNLFHPVPGWTGNFVRTFSENARVLCATSFNGKVFREQDGRFEELPEPPGQKGEGYLGHVDRSGRIWIEQSYEPYHGYWNKLSSSEDTGAFRPPVLHGFYGYWDGRQWQRSILSDLVTENIRGLTGLRDGSLLVVKTNELLWIENEKVVSRLALQLPPGMRGAWSVYEDSNGAVWINEQGLYRIQGAKAIRHFSSTNGLTHDSVRFTFEDRESNLWVGTSGGGLMRFKPRQFFAYSSEHGLTERNVKAVLEETPGSMILGTYGGGLFKLQNNFITHAATNRQPFSLWPLSLLWDEKSNLWTGCYVGGLGQESLTLLTPSERRAMPEAGPNKSVNALFRDSQNRIWVGGDQSVSFFAGGRFLSQMPTNGIRLGELHCFAEDPRRHSIWAGSSKGLFRCDQGGWIEIKGPKDEPVTDVLCLRFDSSGALWVGAAGGGLLRLRDGQWSSITIELGSPKATITCILEDDFGWWWLGSNRGVIRVSREDLERAANGVDTRLNHQLFDKSDGFVSEECTARYQSNCLKDSQGRLWFATLKGVVTVDPRLLNLNTNPIPIRLEAVTYVDSQGKKANLIDPMNLPSQGQCIPGPGPRLIIPPGSRQLEAHFAALSFTAPEKVKLKYELYRNQKQFMSEEGTQRSLSSPWLPPGGYELRVTAANNDGYWDEIGLLLAFEVKPYFWETLWFRSLLLAAFGVGIAVFMARLHQNRLRVAEERLRQQEAFARERERSAAMTQHASDAIVLLDAESRVIYESASTPRILGYVPGFLLNKDPLQFIHPEDEPRIRRFLQAGAQSTQPGVPATYRFRHAAGRWIQLESLATNLLDHPGVRGILVTTRDISERKRAEEALQSALAEKTVLLKEVHHRVKNNLQIVCSLLNLQSVRTHNPEALNTLMETGNRVRSMAILHETLYRSENLAKVSFASYIESICAYLWRTYGSKASSITLERRLADVSLELDQGVACGLIVNELVSNALKHAFPDGRSGTIQVEVQVLPANRILLTVADDGVGIPLGLDLRQTETLGHQIIYMLAEKLDGTVAVFREPGTTFRIEFPAHNG